MKPEVLIIEKKNCVIYERKREENDLVGDQQHQHFGVIGIIHINQELFLVIITDRSPVARFPCGNIAYRVSKIDFIPFVQKTNVNKET